MKNAPQTYNIVFDYNKYILIPTLGKGKNFASYIIYLSLKLTIRMYYLYNTEEEYIEYKKVETI